ncbi:MAG: translation initiation factor IF-2 [Minisyncoccia bacterium]
MKKPEHKKMERHPVVCIMGHIDHGKSTLLDYIRKTNIVEGEVGGITQKISAYEVIHKKGGQDKKITFLDTPGHESFGNIRSRGVDVADVAILVVSAEDGVKKQTLEALKCIEGDGLPYIVAINKIDRPNADVEKTKMNLSENGIYLEGYGGSIPFVPISAKTGTGVDELLDMLLLVTEMEELTGDPAVPAEGILIEAYLDTQKGISATLIIKNGSLKQGDYVVCGDSFASTRAMEDFHGKKISEATFSSPIKIIGFNKLPKVGYPFTTFNSKKEAEESANSFVDNIALKPECRIIDENPDIITLPIIIKADNVGSLDGIIHEINKIKNDKVKIRIIAAKIGDISETDVKMATGNKIPISIIGFNVKTDQQARILAERDNITIKNFNIIYKLGEWLEEIMLSNTPKVSFEETTARAKILKYFSSVKDKQVCGGRVEMGTIKVGDEIKIMRNAVEIGKGKIRELQQQKEKTSEVREGVEFGCMIQSAETLAPGDKIEVFETIIK